MSGPVQESTDSATPPGAGPVEPARTPPPAALSPRELARWAWRQLTSMRTALVLLLLLALGAVPGSIIPQEDVDAFATARWKADHPTLTPIYDSLGLFSVYNSPWFSAIYLLLMVSLVGCILPRTRVYWRGMRARPPRAPRHFGRLPQSRTVETDLAPAEALDVARARLRKRRYRISDAADAPELSAERGYLREAGNLVFHVSVLVVLVGFGMGSMFGYKGGVIVVTGNGFSNVLSQYDDFVPGSMFDPEDLAPYSFTVDDFEVDFITEGAEAGLPRDFNATLTYRERPEDAPETYNLAVNHPLRLDGGDVFLVGHGYAPRITVRDGDGEIASAGPVTFLPEDGTFASFGVVKVPDARPTQIGLEGMFYPTYGFTMERGPFSAFPDAANPVLSMLAYSGDLGLDSGAPQSIYELDKDGLEPIERADGQPYRLDLELGQTKTLPGGAGTVSFDGLDRWVKLQTSQTPGKGTALGGVVLALIGLLGSLFIRPRRMWVRVRPAGGDDPRRTVVEVGGLDRTSGGDGLAEEVDALVRELERPATTTNDANQEHP